MQYLYAQNSEINDDALRMIATQFRNLRLLDIKSTDITNKGIAFLEGMPRLAIIDLTNTKINDEATRSLATLTMLNRLSINQTFVTEPGLLPLTDCKTLTEINATHLQADCEPIREFRRMRPDVDLLFSKRSTTISNAYKYGAQIEFEMPDGKRTTHVPRPIRPAANRGCSASNATTKST